MRRQIACVFIAILVLGAIQASAGSNPARRKIIGYHKPVRQVCKVVHANLSYLSHHTITGARTSTLFCASPDLPFGTRVYIDYYIRRQGRKVKKTSCWIVADRPKYRDPQYTRIEPYIRSVDRSYFLATFEGVRKVTIIKPIYAA